MLEKLFTQYSSALHRYLLRKKCTPSLASDLVQDTFVRIAQLENPETVLRGPAYLFRVAYNLMIDHYRRYGEKRYDNDASAFFDTLVDEQNYTFILRAPRLAVQDIVPSLTVKYNKVESNIDWLYSYDKNSISLKLEKQF
ncbi:RNA polymerase sigma factor [compost metagenome]